MDTCQTVKVKPWGKGQGEFVEINADDFDPARHVLLEPATSVPSAEAPAEPAGAKAAPAKRGR